MTETTSTLTYGKWSVNANDLPPGAISYLLHNGFTQSMTDAAAFTKAQKEGKSESEIEVMASDARDKRFAAILAGTVGVRVGGPRLPAIDRAMQDIVDEMLAAICSARKVALPKGDVLKAARAKLLAKNGDAIRAKAQARLDEAKSLVEDAGDIDFGSPEGEQEAA